MTLVWKSMHQIKKEGLEAVSIWPPIAGHYQWMNADETRSAIVIWWEEVGYGHEYPEDILHEEDGQLRAFFALRDGKYVSVNNVWPEVRGREITEDEYEEIRSLP